MTATCSKCVLSDNYWGVKIAPDGLCNHCHAYLASGTQARRVDENLAALAQKIGELKGQGGVYDCVVAFSGGKDSTYALMTLVRDYGLNCLACSIDNGFMPDETIRNLRKVTAELGVDLVVMAPAWNFLREMFGKSATKHDVYDKRTLVRASSICLSCISMINNIVFKLALQHRAPMVAGGYIGGQTPNDSPLMEIRLDIHRKMKRQAVEKSVANFGEKARAYFDIEDHLYDGYGRENMVFVNPMLAKPLEEEKIVEKISALGWVAPKSTGKNSTNCTLNDLGIALHHKEYGLHPYAFEIADMVRKGTLSREDGLKRISQIPDLSDCSLPIKKLGIDLGDE